MYHLTSYNLFWKYCVASSVTVLSALILLPVESKSLIFFLVLSSLHFVNLHGCTYICRCVFAYFFVFYFFFAYLFFVCLLTLFAYLYIAVCPCIISVFTAENI